jgi:hypothetical protein
MNVKQIPSSNPGLISRCSRLGTFCLEKVIIAASSGTVVKMTLKRLPVKQEYILAYIISCKGFLVII